MLVSDGVSLSVTLKLLTSAAEVELTSSAELLSLAEVGLIMSFTSFAEVELLMSTAVRVLLTLA